MTVLDEGQGLVLTWAMSPALWQWLGHRNGEPELPRATNKGFPHNKSNVSRGTPGVYFNHCISQSNANASPPASRPGHRRSRPPAANYYSSSSSRLISRPIKPINLEPRRSMTRNTPCSHIGNVGLASVGIDKVGLASVGNFLG